MSNSVLERNRLLRIFLILLNTIFLFVLGHIALHDLETKKAHKIIKKLSEPIYFTTLTVALSCVSYIINVIYYAMFCLYPVGILKDIFIQTTGSLNFVVSYCFFTAHLLQKFGHDLEIKTGDFKKSFPIHTLPLIVSYLSAVFIERTTHLVSYILVLLVTFTYTAYMVFIESEEKFVLYNLTKTFGVVVTYLLAFLGSSVGFLFFSLWCQLFGRKKKSNVQEN